MAQAKSKTSVDTFFTGELPAKGLTKEKLLGGMEQLASGDADFKQGKLWSLVYHKDEEHYDTIKQAHNMYFSTNYLNPMAFKSLKRYETDVVRMTANMMRGDENVVGTMTSGGTE
ncbi:MAG: sphinganine-1-phosphate aldolase, partial [Chitinophagales bacterium]